MTSETKGTCAKYMRYAKIVFAVVSIVVSIFDLGTDWFSFSVFVRNDGENLAIAYAVVCTLSTILFALEIHNGVMAYRVYTREPTETVVAGAGGIVVKDLKWERKLETLAGSSLFPAPIPRGLPHNCNYVHHISKRQLSSV